MAYIKGVARKLPQHNITMTSITQNEVTSKYEYSPDFPAEVTHTVTSGTGYKRTLEYREWRNRAAAAMFDAGYEDDAVDFLKCAETPSCHIASDTKVLPTNASTVWVCDSNPDHSAHLFYACCDGRYCPDCAHRQVARFARRYIPAVLKASEKRGANRLRHIILTTPLSLTDTDCKQKVRNYWSAVGRLWKWLAARSAKWTTAGTIEAFEFGENGHKLHFHIIHSGRYLPQKAISEGWHALTGGQAEVTYVRGIGAADDATEDEIANEVIEILKYSIKFWSKDAAGNIKYLDPELMPHLITALKGQRRVRSRGIFYNIQEPPRQPMCCATCGEQMLRVGVVFFPIWQATGYSPEEYTTMRDGNRLQSILANKSVSENGKGNKSPPTEQANLPGFYDTRSLGKSHYEEASNRKPS